MGSKGSRKRDFILDQAKMLFIEKGYVATTMDELVKELGVSKGSIYYHFKNKEELFLSLVEKNTDDLDTSWLEIRDRFATPVEQLYGLAAHYVEEFQKPLSKVAEEFSLNVPLKDKQTLDRMLVLLQKPRQRYCEVLRAGQETGDFRGDLSAERLAVLLAGLLDGLSSSSYEFSPEELKQLYDDAIRCFLQGVQA